MKLIIALTLVWTLAQADKLDGSYLPPNSQNSGVSGGLPQAPYSYNGNQGQNGNGYGGFDERPERPQAVFERNAQILRQDYNNDGQTYSYSFETSNGITADESGVATNGVQAQGGYAYTGDDGKIYAVRYTADQNGFVPQGDHFPTPPPIPQEILRALEQNARDEAAGIIDDGSYAEGKYSDSSSGVNNAYLPPGQGDQSGY